MQSKTEDNGDAQLLIGVRKGERRALAKAITLVESTLPEHVERAQKLIAEIIVAADSSVGAGHTLSNIVAFIGMTGNKGVRYAQLIVDRLLYLQD